MVFGAFYVEHIRLGRLIAVHTGVLRQLIYLLLGDYDRVLEVEARQVDELQGVVFLIDFVENLPCNIKLDPLSHHLHLVLVLVLEVRAFLELQRVVLIGELLIKPRLSLLHVLIEYFVVLLPDLLMQVLLLHRHVQLARLVRRIIELHTLLLLVEGTAGAVQVAPAPMMVPGIIQLIIGKRRLDDGTRPGGRCLPLAERGLTVAKLAIEIIAVVVTIFLHTFGVCVRSDHILRPRPRHGRPLTLQYWHLLNRSPRHRLQVRFALLFLLAGART